MKSKYNQYKGRAWSLAASLSFAAVAHGSPAVQSIDVSPSPLVTGHPFTVTVSASADVTQAVAQVNFRPGDPQALEIDLAKRGEVWTGEGITPTSIKRQLPGQAGAMVKVVLYDSNHGRAEGVAHVGLHIEKISAVFTNGVLNVNGDSVGNTIIVGRDLAGTILVNGGTIPVSGGVPTVGATSLINVMGHGGDDVLTIDDANGAMPPAHLYGGEGNDVLTGSGSDDVLDGGPGNDTLDGRAGNDQLFGGEGNDVLIGGRGTDAIFGGDGDDMIVWNPGDGSDVVEGEQGSDVLVFNGSNAAETVDIAPDGKRLRFFRDVANVTMDCAGIEQVLFKALGGADSVTVHDLAGTDVSNVVVDLTAITGNGDASGDTVFVNGTTTNDVIKVSGSTNEVNVVGLSATVTVVGGESNLDKLVINSLAGDDVVDASGVEAGAMGLVLNGGRGNDLLIGGAGDDLFVWNPGDGSDVLEGQAGQDTMLFNGANVAEQVDISANGQRLRFFRDIAGITMDCAGVEIVKFNALGGADTITVNDLTGTDVMNVDLDLAAAAGSATGDNTADVVIVKGTLGNDNIEVSGDAAGIVVQGLKATVNITGTDPTLDRLDIKALAGDDIVTATGLKAGAINLAIEGDEGDDLIVGSDGDDILSGGDGDDILNGGPGLDVLDGGPGSNVLIQ